MANSKPVSSDLTKEINAVRRFIRTLERYVNEEGYRPRVGYADDWVLLALVSKCLWVARAACLLVKTGFSEEAFGLSRSLVDAFITARYICNKDSDERARRYANYFAKENELWQKIANQYFPHVKLRRREDQAKLTSMAKQFKDPHRWSGHSTRFLAEELDTFEKDQSGKPVKYSFDYEVIFSWTSRYVHVTSSVLDSHIGKEGVPFRIAKAELADLGEGDSALFNVALYLSRMFIYVFRKLGSGIPQRVEKKMLPLLQLLVVSGNKRRRVRLQKKMPPAKLN